MKHVYGIATLLFIAGLGVQITQAQENAGVRPAVDTRVETPETTDPQSPEAEGEVGVGAEVAVEAEADVAPSPPVWVAPPTPVQPTVAVEPVAAEEDVAEEEDAEDEPFPLRVSASIFTRPELRTGYTDLGQADTDFVRYRFRLGLELQPLDLGRLTIGARFVPQAAGFWSSGGALSDPSLGIHEAVLLLTRNRFRFEVGRFEMAYGEELVIGTVAWHQVGRAFDGARMRVSLNDDGAFLDVFATQLNEAFDVNFANNDVFFFGAYGGLGSLLSESLDLDVYFLSRINAETDMLPRTHINTLGSRFRYRGSMIDARAEAGIQLAGADELDLRFAYQADVEVGATFGPMRLALEGLIASGDNGENMAAWNQLFPTAHKFLGVADIVGARSNVVSGVLHAQFKLLEELRASVDAHVFARPEDTPAMADNAGYLGFEADIGLRWVVVPGLALRGNYSLFIPNEDVFGTSHTAHFAELELRYTR